MTKKSLTKVYDFDKETMKKEILTKYEKKNSNNKYFKLSLIPLSLVIIVIGIFTFNFKTSPIVTYNKVSETSFYANKDDDKFIKDAARLDIDIKTKDNDINFVWPSILKDGITLPKDLENKEHPYAVYTKDEKTKKYTNLNSYVYSYYNDPSARSIRLAFSETEEPLKDYYFDIENAKKSKINNYELLIYQYHTFYFAEFNYKGYNFDIETRDITEEELISLLKSILK